MAKAVDSVVLSLAILLTVATYVYSMACTNVFCANVRCASVTPENCDGRITKNGTSCGCCDSCVTILQPGANCSTVAYRGGPPKTVECPENYSCDASTKTCQPNKS